MSDSCCNTTFNNKTPQFLRALKICLFLNAVMFIVEMVFGIKAHSSSLASDALDFLGDAASYTISIAVASSSLKTKAVTSIFKAAFMLLYSLFIFFMAAYNFIHNIAPQGETMGVISLIALFVNALCAFLLYRFRGDDSNAKSVWLCSRNDAIGNILVLIAGIMVIYTSSNIADLIVTGVMLFIVVKSAISILLSAKKELMLHEHK